MSQPANPKRPKPFRRVLYAFALLLLVGVALIAVAWSRFNATPEYWRIIDAKDQRIVEQAEVFENRLTTNVTRVRQPADTFEVQLNEQSVNHWIATRLQRWLTNQSRAVDPETLDRIQEFVHNPLLVFRDGRVILAFRLTMDQRHVIVSAEYEPRTEPDGSVWLHLAAIRGGTQRLPIDMLFNLAVDSIEEGTPEQRRAQVEEIRQAISRIEMKLPLPGEKRTVHVEKITIADGAATLLCRSLLDAATPRASTAAGAQ